jgi:hypothetical protein
MGQDRPDRAAGLDHLVTVVALEAGDEPDAPWCSRKNQA